MNNEKTFVIDVWFKKNDITIDFMTNTIEKVIKTKRLLYTWKNCFAINVKNVKIIDIIEYSIDFESNAKFIRNTLFKYISKKRKFANRIFSKFENVDIIIKRNNKWKIKFKFSFKKKSNFLRIIYNFIFLNRWTIKFVYFIYHLKKFLINLLKFKYRIFFNSNIAYEYWAISMKSNDENKTKFLISNEQWIYLKMKMNLKKIAHIYVQFNNIVFELFSFNDEKIIKIINLIKNHDKYIFSIFMNDHEMINNNFEFFFEFLHICYFSKYVFESIYLINAKTHVFSNNLKILNFQKNVSKLRLSIKHFDKIKNWFTSINKTKLNAFFWLIFFLRIFISNKTQHVMKMKKFYLMQIIDEFKFKLNYNEKIEKCDQNLIKSFRHSKFKKIIVKRKWIEKNIFDWNENQQIFFETMKRTINDNVMIETNFQLQYHLTIDANEKILKICLFQLHDIFANIEITSKFLINEKIIMFMSFRLQNVEIRY